MKFSPDQIVIKPGHNARTWQSCDYYVDRINLFHERTYFSHNVFKEIHSAQWIPGEGTLAKIQRLADKHGGEAIEEHYPQDESNPLYFLAFNDTEKAIAFCLTEDFDKLCLTMEKV